MLKITLFLALLGSAALAQDTAPVVGDVHITADQWAALSLVLGWVTKEIASPITALLKKRFGFQGSASQYIYVVLSVLILAALGLYTGAFGHGKDVWINAAIAAAVAVLKGFGDYTKQQQAAASVQAPTSAPVEGEK